MDRLGLFLILFGTIGLSIALNMDATVEVPSQTIRSGEFKTYVPSQRVHNIGRMDERHNWLSVSELVLVCGVLLYGFGVLNEQRYPQPHNDERNVYGRALKKFLCEDGAKNNETPDSIPESSEVPEVSGKAGIDDDDFGRLLGAEPLPPKFDERGRPLQPVAEQM